MKTIFIKIASVLLVISMLTSCLDGGDAYIEVSEDFAYIRTDEGIGKYAMTFKSGPVTSDKVNNLIQGNAYYVSYKANYKGNYLEAERFELLEAKPVPFAQFSFSKPYSNVPEVYINDSIHPKSMQLGACAPYNSFDDYWEIKYNVAMKAGDEVEVYYYYDKNGQFENGQPLKENQAIIDVRFVKTFKSGSTQDAENKILKAMGSLGEFRRTFPVVYKEGEEYTKVALKFRYIMDVNNVAVQYYVGSFSSSGSESLYYMTFVKGQ